MIFNHTPSSLLIYRVSSEDNKSNVDIAAFFQGPPKKVSIVGMVLCHEEAR